MAGSTWPLRLLDFTFGSVDVVLVTEVLHTQHMYVPEALP